VRFRVFVASRFPRVAGTVGARAYLTLRILRLVELILPCSVNGERDSKLEKSTRNQI
jgi:hypothetical protein